MDKKFLLSVFHFLPIPTFKVMADTCIYSDSWQWNDNDETSFLNSFVKDSLMPVRFTNSALSDAKGEEASLQATLPSARNQNHLSIRSKVVIT